MNGQQGSRSAHVTSNVWIRYVHWRILTHGSVPISERYYYKFSWCVALRDPCMYVYPVQAIEELDSRGRDYTESRQGRAEGWGGGGGGKPRTDQACMKAALSAGANQAMPYRKQEGCFHRRRKPLCTSRYLGGLPHSPTPRSTSLPDINHLFQPERRATCLLLDAVGWGANRGSGACLVLRMQSYRVCNSTRYVVAGSWW